MTPTTGNIRSRTRAAEPARVIRFPVTRIVDMAAYRAPESTHGADATWLHRLRTRLAAWRRRAAARREMERLSVRLRRDVGLPATVDGRTVRCGGLSDRLRRDVGLAPCE